MHHGRFVWHELMTTDRPAAEAFYGRVVGWTMRDAGMEGMTYLLLGAGDGDVGGIVVMPEGSAPPGWKPRWTGVVGVDDVDAAAARVAQSGGTVVHPPKAIPGIGAFAIIADPDGSQLTLLRRDVEVPPPDAMAPRHFAWNELYCADLKVFDFYADLFGWTKAEVYDMGEMGVYQVFARDGVSMGGIMRRVDPSMETGWQFYVSTPSIERAMADVASAGGTVVFGPQDVPGGAFIINALDDRGTMISFVGPRH